MLTRILNWLKKAKFSFGRVKAFEDAEECDPNEPCRNVEPETFNGVKVTLPWPGDVEEKEK